MKVDLNTLMKAIDTNSSPGFCLQCACEAYNIDPDAERYPCEECGQRSVYGAEQILLLGLVV